MPQYETAPELVVFLRFQRDCSIQLEVGHAEKNPAIPRMSERPGHRHPAKRLFGPIATKGSPPLQLTPARLSTVPRFRPFTNRVWSVIGNGLVGLDKDD